MLEFCAAVAVVMAVLFAVFLRRYMRTEYEPAAPFFFWASLIYAGVTTIVIIDSLSASPG